MLRLCVNVAELNAMFIEKQPKNTSQTRAQLPASRKVTKRKTRDTTEPVNSHNLVVYKPTTTISKASASSVNKPDVTVVSACIRCTTLCYCLSL